MNRWGRARGLRLPGMVVALTAVTPAMAQVTQTDAIHTPLPQPVPAAELSIVDDSWAWNANTVVHRDPLGVLLTAPMKYGDFYAPPTYPQFVTGDAINLSGIFKWRREAIDPSTDATTGPGYLSAKCGFSAELLLLGGNCQATFGWYNVLDPASKTPPAAAEIYPLISTPYQALQCVAEDGKTPKRDGFCPLAWDNRDPYNLSVLRWVPKVFSSGDLSQDPRYKGGYVGFALVGDPQKCPQSKYSMYEQNQRNSNGVPWVTTLIYESSIDPNGVYLAFEDLPMSPADWKKSSDSSSNGADGDFNDYVVYVSAASCPGDVDAACVGKQCPSGQACQLGVCKDPCSGVICPGNAVCSNGSCSSAPSGAGGSAGGSAGAGGNAAGLTFGGSSSTGTGTGTGRGGSGQADEESAGGAYAAGDAGDAGDAGRAGDDHGTTSAAGMDALGGASTGGLMPASPSERKSSSCGYAALTSGQPLHAWSVLGLAFGLTTFVRRRRRARASIGQH